MTPSRRDFLALSLFGLATAAVGCGTAAGNGGAETKTLRYQGWAGQVTPPELAADLGYLGDVKLEWVGNTTSGPQDIQSAATGQVDFGGAFNGAVVKLVGAGAPVRAVIGYYGIDQNTFNGFYVLEDSPIRSARDLIGKKVGMNTLGAHSEAMLGIYLQRNGISREEAKGVEALALPPVNTEQSLRQKQIDVAVLGGILRDKAVAAGGIRPLFNDFELLGAFTAGTYVLTEKFLQQNPGTVRTFVTGVAKAIEWSRTTPRDEVIARFTDIIGRRGRNEDISTLKYWKSYGVAGKGGLIQDKELSIWVDWLAERGEVRKDALTLSDAYTNDFNELRS
ncbi:ABC transporter substrate-binding protein [Saccharothrix variisporea]|uniref:ABC-type nitrate/sulfonate/bicarbonate transport system substrate-binding protein n=1 Tax=Saccharothrix variisporea TaxID=543527 RepID=A0A495WZB0_9PSEU|nr:ABC transporter substrate-binding protein [Saccharothrix variisporea]RKT66950.1 ABC-type nitrate/sulfonate/bicarbonate transport system substrate-binding protein [Saccharothrix variisporea]